jgi:hypothetical protein
MKKLINQRSLLFLLLIVAGVAIIQSCVVSYPYTYYNPNQIPLSDIVRMSKNGLYSKDIIQEIKNSHSIYGIKADQFAKLRDAGVQDSVLNYMQITHMDAIRRDQQIADSYYGWPYGYYGGFGYGWPYGYYGGFGFGWPYGYYGWGWGPAIIYGGHYGYGGYHGGYHGGYYHGGGSASAGRR